MKVILSGATGFIGSEVLRQCLKAPSITSVVALSRRNLPESVANNPKLKVVIMDNFTTYPDTVLKELAGAEACIWALGSPRSTRQVEVDYPIVAANTFVTALAPQLQGRSRFRFVYLSGMAVVRDQNAKLWYWSEPRKWKGETENQLIELSSKHPDALQTLICRPGMVLSPTNPLPSFLVGVSRSIVVDELAACMLDIATAGSETQTLENAVLRTRGQVLLREGASRDR